MIYSKEFYEKIKEGSYNSAKEVIPLLIEAYNPKSVVDVGCGIGTWLKVFQEQGVKEIYGIDGDWIDEDQLLIPKDKFQRIDLDYIFYTGLRFDLVLCLEIAEHLNNEGADQFIYSLAKLSNRIVFSAAIPKQGGKRHLNEQSPHYWSEIFAKYGYGVDDWLRYKIWNNNKVEWWYRQNILVYEKGKKVVEPLFLIHPSNYLRSPEK